MAITRTIYLGWSISKNVLLLSIGVAKGNVDDMVAYAMEETDTHRDEDFIACA